MHLGTLRRKMSKNKIKYVCSNCGYESLRWLGKCPECESWNSFAEEIVETSKRNHSQYQGKTPAVKISEVKAGEEERMKSRIPIAF